MRIIYLHQYFNTPDMVGGTRSYEMARRLVLAGYEVHIVTSWRENDRFNRDWFLTDEAGIKVHWLPVAYSNYMSYRERVMAFFRFAISAIHKVKELDGDVIFATSTPLTIAIPAILASRKNKTPIVFEVRDLWPDIPIAMKVIRNPIIKWCARRLEGWAYRNSESIVALSPGMKSGVVRAGVRSERVAVIPNGSDNQEFVYKAELASRFRNERAWLGARPLMVYTGTFGRVNGVDYMVYLAKELLKINPAICILLVGDGQEKAQVIELAKKMEVLDVNLFVEDPLPKKQIPALLSAADMASSLVIDMPEMQANSANKFFDALAAGVPLFINYGGWQYEIIRRKECGLTGWQKPVSEVAEALAERITDNAWLEDAGRSARDLAERFFDRDKLARQLEDVIAASALRKGEIAESIAPGDYHV